MMIKPILLCYIEEKNPRNALVDAIHLDSSTPIFITKTLIPPRRLRRGGMSNMCVFHGKLDTHSIPNWTGIPRETGRSR